MKRQAVIDFENQMQTLVKNNSHRIQKMKEQELGPIEDVVGVEQKSKLKREAKKFEEVIKEGGQQEEKLTHWIMPDHVFLSYVRERERKDNSLEVLRKHAKIGESWFTLTEEDL